MSRAYLPSKTSSVAARPVVRTNGPVLSLRSVTRCFGPRYVLGPVDLDVDAGAVCLVEGPNGAGKTTLLRIAAELLAPTTGECRHGGPNEREHGSALYIRPGAGARVDQTIAQALDFCARISTVSGVPPDAALELVGLAAEPRTRVGALSAGQRARLSLAVALVAGTSLVCLDEPTAHLDAAGSQRAGHCVRTLVERGSAVLVATPEAAASPIRADAQLALRDGLLEVRR